MDELVKNAYHIREVSSLSLLPILPQVLETDDFLVLHLEVKPLGRVFKALIDHLLSPLPLILLQSALLLRGQFHVAIFIGPLVWPQSTVCRRELDESVPS